MASVLVGLRRAVSVAVAVLAIFVYGLRAGASAPVLTAVEPEPAVASVVSTSFAVGQVGFAAATAAGAAVTAASAQP